MQTDQGLQAARSPIEAFGAMVDAYATVLATNRELLAVAGRNLDHLPDADRTRIRRRQVDYRQRAQSILMQVRPDLDDGMARTMLIGAYALAGQVSLASRTASTPAIAALMTTFLMAQPSTADAAA